MEREIRQDLNISKRVTADFAHITEWLHGLIYKPGWEITIVCTQSLEIRLDVINHDFVPPQNTFVKRDIGSKTLKSVRFDRRLGEPSVMMMRQHVFGPNASELDDELLFLQRVQEMIADLEKASAEAWQEATAMAFKQWGAGGIAICRKCHQAMRATIYSPDDQHRCTIDYEPGRPARRNPWSKK